MESSLGYYKLGAEDIYNDINDHIDGVVRAEVEGVDLVIFPHVYPSHKFRTTGFVLKNIKELVKGKKICDMGCGPGIVGIFSLQNDALEVVQADINPSAVENAKENNTLHGYTENQIKTYLSDCFDTVPKNSFDLIIFNMPFHCDPITIDDPLKYAFYDPAFSSIKKFLHQAKNYSHKGTKVFIAFSSKGKTEILENIFEQTGYDWSLWKITNTDQEFDNRIYLLKESED